MYELKCSYPPFNIKVGQASVGRVVVAGHLLELSCKLTGSGVGIGVAVAGSCHPRRRCSRRTYYKTIAAVADDCNTVQRATRDLLFVRMTEHNEITSLPARRWRKKAAAVRNT